MIDGTAPHEYDMRYPAVRDTLVDLSRGLDASLLSPRRETIASLMKDKSKCYKNAYSYLHLAGISRKIVENDITEGLDCKATEGLIDCIKSGTRGESKRVKKRLYSSVSRLGLTHLSKDIKQYERVYAFPRSIESEIIITTIYNKIFSGDITVFPSPLSEEIVDGFIIESSGTAVIMRDDECDFDTELYIRKSDRDNSAAMEIYKKAIDEAKKRLIEAFKYHEELEKIYGEAMDFSVNDEIYASLIEKINIELNN